MRLNYCIPDGLSNGYSIEISKNMVLNLATNADDKRGRKGAKKRSKIEFILRVSSLLKIFNKLTTNSAYLVKALCRQMTEQSKPVAAVSRKTHSEPL